MTDVDRASLDRILPAPSGPPDWDDVMRRSGAVQSHRRRRLVVLAAAALAVAVGTAAAFGLRAIVLDGGFAGLPPKGATPSTPETGELALRYQGRPELSGPRSVPVPESGPVKQVWVYADGRVISRREAYAVDDVGTGFLEQRLTPEGVELLRSEIISTGLFERDLALWSAHGLVAGAIQIANGDRLVDVFWCCFGGGGAGGGPDPRFQRAKVATKQQARALRRLTKLLRDPASLLPASAWEDRELRGYVPSKYAICYWGATRSLEPSRILRLLPPAAQDRLRGKDRTYQPFSPHSVHQVSCSEVTTDEARALEEIFSLAGFKRDRLTGSPWAYAFQAPDPRGTVRKISFEPILPHGQWEAMGG